MPSYFFTLSFIASETFDDGLESADDTADEQQISPAESARCIQSAQRVLEMLREHRTLIIGFLAGAGIGFAAENLLQELENGYRYFIIDGSIIVFRNALIAIVKFPSLFARMQRVLPFWKDRLKYDLPKISLVGYATACSSYSVAHGEHAIAAVSVLTTLACLIVGEGLEINDQQVIKAKTEKAFDRFERRRERSRARKVPPA